MISQNVEQRRAGLRDNLYNLMQALDYIITMEDGVEALPLDVEASAFLNLTYALQLQTEQVSSLLEPHNQRTYHRVQ